MSTRLFISELYFLMEDSVTTEDLALVLLGRWVDVGDHGCSVGHEDGVHETPGHHADHDDPHFNIVWRTRHRHTSSGLYLRETFVIHPVVFFFFLAVDEENVEFSLVGASMDP